MSSQGRKELNCFCLNGRIYDLIHTLENHLVQHNEQYHRKELLSSFHLKGHALGFHPQSLHLEPLCTT